MHRSTSLRGSILAIVLLSILYTLPAFTHGQNTAAPPPTLSENISNLVKRASSPGSATPTSLAPSTPQSPPPPSPPSPSTPRPPLQPYTTDPAAPAVAFVGPLPLPTTPATFPQNISTCSTCYSMFPTLSRCNVIANTNTFPVTANTTYESLLPFLKCICTRKALDTYPYCLDCLTKTRQLDQLNVLQANHLENYSDAFHQLCGVTYNGNRDPSKSRASSLAGTLAEGTVVLMGLALVSLLVVLDASLLSL
ncbi:hypothetical protein BGZ68_004411 [Mortierella alpina]|nr:hypothetical protein BGZ68_004411 [Mortierella alpina]